MKRNLLVALVALLMLGVPAVTYAQDAPPAKVAPVTEEAKPAPATEEAKPAPAKVAAPAKDEKKVAAPAKAEPVTDENIGKQVGLLVEAVQAGKWSVAAGLLLSLLIWVVRKFGILDKLNKQVIPWAVAGVGILGYIAMALVSGLDWVTALQQGFAVGLQAVGLWEMLLKRFLKPQDPVTPEPAPSA